MVTKTVHGGSWMSHKNSVMLADLEAADNPMIEKTTSTTDVITGGRGLGPAVLPLERNEKLLMRLLTSPRNNVRLTKNYIHAGY